MSEIVASSSSDVITTPKGIPPAGVQVIIINVGELYLSRLEVASIYTNSPDCLNICYAHAVTGVHTANTNGWVPFEIHVLAFPCSFTNH